MASKKGGTALAVKPVEPEVMAPDYVVTKVGEQQIITLSHDFLARLKPAAEAIGEKMIALTHTAQERYQIALSITEAFNAWKKINKGPLPQFVRDMVYPDCPHTSYGQEGSKQRKELNQHKGFVGIETMVKKGQKGLKLAAERQAYLNAGIDPDDSKAVAGKRKKEVTAKAKAKTKGFVAAIVGLNEDVTQESITAMLVWAGKVERDNGKPTKNLSADGIALLDAALKALGLEALDAAGRADETEDE